MGNRSRTLMATRNFAGSILERFMKFLIEFITRTFFIKLLGATYLGVNGLFTNVLGLLSLAELGISSAISFALYQPLAENDQRKILAIIQFYKKTYRIVALAIAIMGLALIPFIGYIVKEPEGVEHLRLIYILFLANTCLSYLFVYKFTIFSADQKRYVVSLYETIVEFVVLIFQLMVLLITKNYILYLITNILILQLGRFCFLKYTDHKYPYLNTKEKAELDLTDRNMIMTKVKALFFHKVGTVAVYQTDNIIISSLINVTTVGLVSNFTLFITVASQAISSLLNASVAGLGNIIATESDEKKYRTFKNYDFIGFWLYGLATVCLFFLMKPFVGMWLGADKLIDSFTIGLLCINFYFAGQRVTLENMKVAAGVYEQDKWFPIMEAIVNLAVSILLAIKMGLPGVYIGTFVSGIIPNLTKPYMVYKYVLKKDPKEYYKKYVLRFLMILVCILTITGLGYVLPEKGQLLSFVIRLLECLIVPNLLFYLVYRKTPEIDYCINYVTMVVKKIIGNK